MMHVMPAWDCMTSMIAQLGVEIAVYGSYQLRISRAIFNLSTIRQILILKMDLLGTRAQFFNARHILAMNPLGPGKIALDKFSGDFVQMFAYQVNLLLVVSIFNDHLLLTAVFCFIEHMQQRAMAVFLLHYLPDQCCLSRFIHRVIAAT